MSDFIPQENTPTQAHRLSWEGIEIEINYTPVKWGSISHIEIAAMSPLQSPLPVSKTGYRSHFVPIGTVEEQPGSVADQVRAWLDEEAKSDEWQDHLIDTRQGSLF